MTLAHLQDTCNDFGPNWGIWETNEVMKPGMEAVFDTQFYPTNWDGIIGGSGEPNISITNIPPLGSEANLVEGVASHIAPFDVFLCLYIEVSGSWYQKPFYNEPFITIASDGSWQSPYATGGDDIAATNFAVYMFPTNYSPPFVSGQTELPDELQNNAIATGNASR